MYKIIGRRDRSEEEAYVFEKIRGWRKLNLVLEIHFRLFLRLEPDLKSLKSVAESIFHMVASFVITRRKISSGICTHQSLKKSRSSKCS